jgi:hypothetical protein
MTELKKYVDELFRHQPGTPEIQDLKEEILSNMAAKRDDFISQGMEKDLATARAKESLPSIDLLVEGNQLTDLGKYHFECSETALLHCIIYWILSLPLLYTTHGIFCYAGLLSTIILSANYILRRMRPSDHIGVLSIRAKKRQEQIVWILWGLFFLTYAMMTAALTLGSNLWFGKPLHIDGPYQAANLAAGIYIPMIGITVPITFSSFTKLLAGSKMEHSDN